MYFILDRINVLSLRMIAGNYVVKLYMFYLLYSWCIDNTTYYNLTFGFIMRGDINFYYKFCSNKLLTKIIFHKFDLSLTFKFFYTVEILP